MDAATEAALRADQRAGAKAILDAVARRRFENRSEGQRLRHLLRYEWARWATGVLRVAGVDEAGMSPLAGPVAAAAGDARPGTRATAQMATRVRRGVNIRAGAFRHATPAASP